MIPGCEHRSDAGNVVTKSNAGPVRWQEELVDEERKHVVRFYPQVDGVGL
jgi:hypothetical protein